MTAEAAPHHFTLTDAAVANYDSVFKVNPPLRPARDVAAIKAGLADGTIDAIATDHAPHAQEDKEQPFDQAPPGMLGLETALSLALCELELPIEQVLALMSWKPARIAGLEGSHGGPDRRGPPRQPVRHRPGGHVGRRAGGAGQPQPQHALRRPQAHRPQPPHRPAGRAGGHRRGGPAMRVQKGSYLRPFCTLDGLVQR